MPGALELAPADTGRMEQMVTFSLQIVQAFYTILIPAIIGSLLLYILFDLANSMLERSWHGDRERPAEVNQEWQD